MLKKKKSYARQKQLARLPQRTTKYSVGLERLPEQGDI